MSTDIQFNVDAYFPKDKFSKEVRDLAIMACMNVERETRHRITSRIFDLANEVNNDRPNIPEA